MMKFLGEVRSHLKGSQAIKSPALALMQEYGDLVTEDFTRFL